MAQGAGPGRIKGKEALTLMEMSKSMKPLETVGTLLYGSRWQQELAHALRVSDRTVRRWHSGSTPIPGQIWQDLKDLARDRRTTCGEAVEVCKQQQEASGYVGKTLVNKPSPAINPAILQALRPDLLAATKDMLAKNPRYGDDAEEKLAGFVASAVRGALQHRLWLRDIAEQCAAHGGVGGPFRAIAQSYDGNIESDQDYVEASLPVIMGHAKQPAENKDKGGDD